VSGLRVAYVLGTSGGGTGAHVAMLAEGCAAHGVAVAVYGPAATGRRFFPAVAVPAAAGGGDAGRPAAAGGPGRGRPSGCGPGVTFEPVEIAARPRPGRDAAAVLRLRRLLGRAHPGVVHAHGLRAGALAALALALPPRPAPRPALLVTVHNAPATAGPAGLVSRVLERIVARRADEVAWVSSDLAARMRRLGARDGGRALVPAPASAAPGPAEIAAARASLASAVPGGLVPGGTSAAGTSSASASPGGTSPGGTSPGGISPGSGRPGDASRPVVLAAGRLAAQKGFGVLLDAAARWQDRVPVPLVVIAGEGPLAGPLRAQAAGLDVVFPGQRGDMPALLAAADVVTVPSVWEGQPLIVQEALRAGRPLVASRTGGIPDLTGEDGALLVPPGDAGQLAAAVLAVLADPALAARLAAAARARATALPTTAAAIAAALASYQRLTRPASPA
jgi:glycosyltransferase involved in cell wall biosynthesis